MAKKKHINGIDDFDMYYIDSKMRHDTLSEGLEYLDAYKNQLKTLSYKLDIKCKNQKQKEFLNDLRNKSKEVCFGIGSAGTGKSFISLSYALKELKDSKGVKYRGLTVLCACLDIVGCIAFIVCSIFMLK